ncbi:Cu-binding protein [Phialemonium atrogriseum]|uniref:Cu-binding protein n=1 Tax=Phialemonium atrogriseum TaxID=1093897 RepID=A0AAJ0BSF3_9PEZI|nr:Cu-binding protein [Phialemonium atrogriseum]KAK1763625.1 Cu-binding protein [Phialemonium atrogriseum]
MTPSIIRFRPLTFYKSPLELRASLRTRHFLHSFAIELICDMQIMSRSLAPARPLLNSLWKQPARPCRRLLSSQSSQARRPTAASQTASPRHQPLMQRRFKYKTVEEAKSRYRSGPFSWKAGLLFIATGAGLLYYFEREKGRMQRKRVADSNKGVGRPQVGGPFELIDQNGKTMTQEDLKGKYSLVYFGFTHCPDICPEELDKMATMFDIVEAERPGAVLPVFVTCDPARDGPGILKEYLSEFHPRFIGLTGTYDQIKAMCKAYRVYFSTPTEVKPGQDYLVDHSIYFYLMDPEGDFVEALGRQHSPQHAAKIILDHMKDWKGQLRT